MKVALATILALLFAARASALPLGYQVSDSKRRLAPPEVYGGLDPNRVVAHEARKDDQPGDLGKTLERRQLIMPEVHCKALSGSSECTELAAIESRHDGGLEAESTKRPEKRFNIFGAFERTCLQHSDSPACIAWNN